VEVEQLFKSGTLALNGMKSLLLVVVEALVIVGTVVQVGVMTEEMVALTAVS
jgi:hypothetical protein